MSETSLGGVYAAVMMRKAANPKPVCGQIRCIRLGAHGLANKGAIIFPVTAGATRFVFIGCHLTPHQEHWEARNEQLRQLLKLVHEKYDYVMIVGDLNYRIELTYEECLEFIGGEKIVELNEKDQLTLTRASDPDLARLKEPVRNFLPTYKFDANADVYDTSPLKRIPSYTDRVLIRRGRKRLAVDQLQSVTKDFVTPEVMNFPGMPKCVEFRRGVCRFSDHRSVLTTYHFRMPVVQNERLAEVLQALEAEK
jgi:hypothetical protein